MYSLILMAGLITEVPMNHYVAPSIGDRCYTCEDAAREEQERLKADAEKLKAEVDKIRVKKAKPKVKYL